jgi:hypothetical protein
MRPIGEIAYDYALAKSTLASTLVVASPSKGQGAKTYRAGPSPSVLLVCFSVHQAPSCTVLQD